MMKRFCQIILVALCLMGLSSAVHGQTAEERIDKLEVGASKNFHTPEAAIEYFIQCVNNKDYDCALRACAADKIAAGYDYEAMTNRLRMMQPMGYLPSEYAMYAMYNKRWAELQILRQLSWMTFSVILPEKYEAFLEGQAVFNIDFGGVVDDMNPEKMQEIEIVEIGKSDLLDEERTQENFEGQAKIWGAQHMTMRSVLYDIGGEYYVGGFQLLEYNRSWLINALSDVLTGQSPLGALTHVNSKAAFRAMLKQ